MPDGYEEIREHEREEKWTVTVFRYLLSVATFLLLIAIVLSGYWLWEDFGGNGFRGVGPAEIKESLSVHFQSFVEEIRNPCPVARANCE